MSKKKEEDEQENRDKTMNVDEKKRKKKEDRINLNAKSTKLQYYINKQWYTTTMLYMKKSCHRSSSIIIQYIKLVHQRPLDI